MHYRSQCEIRLDAQINNATLLADAQRVLALNPIESIIIRFNHRHAFDFGAWCFACRTGGRAWKEVDLSTRLPKRLANLQTLASHIITASLTSIALSSAYTAVTDWTCMASWCEANNRENFLESSELYYEALTKFTAQLNNDHRAYITRKRIHTACRTFGQQIFPEEAYLPAKIPMVQRPRKKQTKTIEPPSEESVKHHLQTSEPLFIGLTDLVINFTLLPVKLKVNQDFAWITPDTRYPMITGKILSNDGVHSTYSPTIDYREGRMRTLEEYKARSVTTGTTHYKTALKAYASRLSIANSTKDNAYRIRLGRYAHDCFVAMFVANTGINESSLRELPWDPNFEIIKDEEIGMRTIKFRANNKAITVRVKARFINHFKKFVQLRSFFCEGIDHPYLFIGFNGNSKSNYRIMDTNILGRLHASMTSLIDYDVPFLSYKQLRNYKDNYTAKKHGHEAARILLGHSERTQRKNYLKANEKNAVDQIGKFNEVVNEFFNNPHSCSTPVGGCNGEGFPQKKVDSQITSEPNCKSESGCLNCIHHKVHANDEDVWKLLSLEYVTKQMIHASSSQEHFNQIHSPTLRQIDQILNEMLIVNPSLQQKLEDLRKDVNDNNNLTDYWQRHLERLVRLKVVS
ncbi:hypothetical protein [Pseudomonas syringae]|uniref:Integrase n=1 Tax=Pseudomonas syringae TaxID=317 RepID=A0A085VAC5_PSESX|nr:hypothetical protein [Pseudomonas syringae]KFE52388.1 hypothetical protein IV02_08055 [Pseudomonas syringae]